MPPFSDLKAKAAGAANSSKEIHVRDRNTSVPMKETNWDPQSGESEPPHTPPHSLVNSKTKPSAPLPPPSSATGSAAISSASDSKISVSPAPPPPNRRFTIPPPPPPQKSTKLPTAASLSSVPSSPSPPSSGRGPPLIIRSTRPDLRNIQERVVPADEIDWTNLTTEDKEVFFSWLDEFFAKFTPPSVRPHDARSLGSSARSHGIPPSRPTREPWSQLPVGSQSVRLVLSHPLATTYGSGALDLVHYFASTTTWTTAWYNPAQGPSIPPPLVGDRNHTFTSSWISRGTMKITHIGICFSDLSLFWGTVEFSTTSDPSIPDPSAVTRRAVFLPPPNPLGREDLIYAHETYGNTVALYAESYLGTGQYCSRGECWDLATEALKYFLEFDYVPKPVPSISRTHGHLIFGGTASHGGKTIAGRWRGGDDRIRRGDIAEWRKVKIGVKDAPDGSFFSLGDPDHTSIIISDCVPNSTPMDGHILLPTDLGILAVVEQSIGQPPARKEYDLSYFKDGEMWIYRPISMQVYLGVSDLTAEPPPGLQGLLEIRDNPERPNPSY